MLSLQLVLIFFNFCVFFLCFNAFYALIIMFLYFLCFLSTFLRFSVLFFLAMTYMFSLFFNMLFQLNIKIKDGTSIRPMNGVSMEKRIHHNILQPPLEVKRLTVANQTMWQNSKKKRQFFKMETIKTLAEPWALHLIQWCTKKLLGEMKTHIFAPQAAKHRLVPDTCLKAKAPVKA